MLLKISKWRKNTKLRERAVEFVLAAFVILLPFQWDFPPISLFIMLIGVVFFFFFNVSYWAALRSAPYFWPLILYYALVLIGLTYSDHIDEGAKDAQVQIALVSWPIGIAALQAVNRNMLWRLCMYFVRALAVSSILLLYLALQRYLDGATTHTFFYKNLSVWHLVPQHYLSMYLSFGMLFLLYRWFFLKVDKRIHIVEIVIYLALFITMQILLSVRIQWIALPFALIPLIASALKSGLIGKQSLRIGGIVLVLSIMGIALLPGTQRRVLETYHEIRSIKRVVDQKQTNHRVYLWSAGWDVFLEHPLIGAGTGSSNAFMNSKLEDVDAKFWDGKSVYYLRDKEYNVHNVFLQAAMTYGLIGLVLILLILFKPLRAALKNGEAFTASFLILTIISFTTESMLERQAGVLWFAVFYTLLVVINSKLVTAVKR